MFFVHVKYVKNERLHYGILATKTENGYQHLFGLTCFSICTTYYYLVISINALFLLILIDGGSILIRYRTKPQF